ncbi:MAG TPA: cytochrome P450 [Thermoanaerobaculia bacterium]|nr:cytochrome P450 [Thermoanaerobaculia bacterium]
MATRRETERPLPPGRMGWPLLGETLSFLEDGFGFIERRRGQYGPVFKTHLLGRRAVVLVGPEGSGQFIDGAVQRAGAMPPHIQELFGGTSLPLLDGAEHLARKTFILTGFTREALAAYLPVMERMTGEACERWASAGEFAWIEDMKRLSIEVICATVMGIQPGPATDDLRRQYDVVLKAFARLPIPLPGTAYTRAQAALDRILARFEKVLRERQAEPRDDGVSRILAATTAEGGRIGLDECKIELHHLILAGFIVFAELAALVLQLTRHPDVHRRLAAEVATLPPGELRLESLAALPYLAQVVMEVKRLCPIAPVFFGKARYSFEFKDYRVPAGWMVLWAHRSSHLTDDTYPDPERFDPERFAAGRAEHRRHEHAFVPHGAGPAHGHKCPGTDFATVLMDVFAVKLLRGYSWELAAGQDLDYDWKLIPPEPKDGLRARLRRR